LAKFAKENIDMHGSLPRQADYSSRDISRFKGYADCKGYVDCKSFVDGESRVDCESRAKYAQSCGS
jgi:hypothetical protein